MNREDKALNIHYEHLDFFFFSGSTILPLEH